MDSIKCVVIGDGAVGKTCLLISYAKGTFPSDYIPTIFDNYATKITIADKEVSLQLMDTAGQEDYDRLRPLSYGNASVFLICFSLASPNSLQSVKERWYPELKRHSPKVPFILVGTQSDRRRGSTTPNMVTQEEGQRMASDLGAVSYVECSAKTRDNLRDVFVKGIIASLENSPQTHKKNKKCIIQ